MEISAEDELFKVKEDSIGGRAVKSVQHAKRRHDRKAHERRSKEEK